MDRIIIFNGDSQYGEYKVGDKGTVIGYLAKGEVPYIVVLLHETKRATLIGFGEHYEFVTI